MYCDVHDCCSSRFTSSSKYEQHFSSCFQLAEVRRGEVRIRMMMMMMMIMMMMMVMMQVCNACVLIVKRWTQLPGRARGTRHWGHVVDARHGPGMKNVAGRRQTGDTRGRGETQLQEESLGKIRRKQSVIKKETHSDTDTSSVPDFIDLTYWTR